MGRLEFQVFGTGKWTTGHAPLCENGFECPHYDTNNGTR